MSLQPLDEHTTDDRASKTLAGVRRQMGFVPNMLGIMAHAPAALESYLDLSARFNTTSLSPAERQVVLLSVSQHNACDYCVAAHSTLARAQRVDAAVIDALVDNRPIDDPRLQALRRFAQALVATAGRPEPGERQAFLEAGFTEAQMLEVVLGVAFKTLSNYTNHITDPAIDEAFHTAA